MTPQTPHGLKLEDERRIYHAGLQLFNEGQYFEAHDTWEEIWHEVQDRRREKFYRALIQGAVTLELLRRGRAEGVRQVFLSSTELFQGLPETFMGLHIPTFLANLKNAIAPALVDLDAKQIKIDPTRLFTIQLDYDPFETSKNGEYCELPPQP